MADGKRVAWATRRVHVEELLRRHEQERLTFKQLAAESGIALPTLYSWVQQLRRERVSAAVPTAPAVGSRPRFVELASTPASLDGLAGGGLELVLESAPGLRIRVDASFHERTLKRLLVALGA